MKLVFHEEALEDQRDAVARYRGESRELAQRFFKERDAILRRIKQTPKQFPFANETRRAALMRVFPYKIIFEETLYFTLIVALAHTSRHPDYWRDRSL